MTQGPFGRDLERARRALSNGARTLQQLREVTELNRREATAAVLRLAGEGVLGRTESIGRPPRFFVEGNRNRISFTAIEADFLLNVVEQQAAFPFSQVNERLFDKLSEARSPRSFAPTVIFTANETDRIVSMLKKFRPRGSGDEIDRDRILKLLTGVAHQP